jgi:hypothetical protein
VRRARLAPIVSVDVERVGEFLNKNLNSRISGTEWARAACVPWSVEAPNHGFMLLDEDDIVGVYLAFYSTRTIQGSTERFCNLGAWCVLPGYRLHSLQLLKALLAQPGYHFTDLSPSGNTVPINERLKFKRLDTATALMPNLPWPSWARHRRVGSEHTIIERILTGDELKVFRDHQHARATKHVVMTLGNEHCYVIFRRDRRMNLPLFASVLYVSHPPLFQRMAGCFARHVLVRYLVPFTLMELRIVGGQPKGSFLLRSSRPKMFKSDSLHPDQIDNLYSELVCVPW